MRYLSAFLILTAALAAILFLGQKKNTLEIDPREASSSVMLSVPEAQSPSISPDTKQNSDIERQKPLPNPPQNIKGVYLTSWSAGIKKRIDYILDLLKKQGFNAVVLDIKDYSGYVAYSSGLAEAEKYKSEQIRIPQINRLIKKFHDEGIYVIGRVSVFQDPILAKARPDLAIQSTSSNIVWLDSKGLAWADPSSQEAWDYNIAIAKDALARGFDEINFDYIRFPSDGDLEDMYFPKWDGKMAKHEVIKTFFDYLRSQMPNAKISASLFGISTIRTDDLGIGQILEDAYPYFDYIDPMLYPSHYSLGFLGFKNPAEHPYDVVKYSMEQAVNRLRNWQLASSNSTSTVSSPIANYQLPVAKLRPWLQAFDLGAVYGAKMIDDEIKAVKDAGVPETFLLWDPKNTYSMFP